MSAIHWLFSHQNLSPQWCLVNRVITDVWLSFVFDGPDWEVRSCETWDEEKLFVANCALYHVGSCGYTTPKPSVWHSMLPRCRQDQGLKERYVVLLLMVLENMLGAVLYKLFHSMKPKGQTLAIQIICMSEVLVSISPWHFVNRDCL